MANNIVASGYKDLQSTPLGQGQVYAGTIIDRNFEDDMLFHITNSSALDKLLTCGQIMQFDKPAVVGAWRPYELNQQLIADQPSSESFCLQICNSAYKSIKVDKETIRRACDYWDSFETSFLNNAWKQLSSLWQTTALTDMMLQVSTRNSGKKAGRDKNIDLGTIGNPIKLSPTNLLPFLYKIKSVLKSAGRWYDGEMFVVVPTDFEALFASAVSAANLCCGTIEDAFFNGKLADNIAGFTIASCENVRPVLDPATNQLVYPIIAGWNEAYAFTGDIVDARIVEQVDAFGVMYQMLSVFGGGAIYPEALAKAYVSFSTDDLMKP